MDSLKRTHPFRTPLSSSVGISKSNLKFDVCIDGVSVEDSSPGVCQKQTRLMKKGFASARGSAILATLSQGISKLSGPRWIQKVDNLKSSRRNVSEIKLKRTDTTLDLLDQS
jgi:hypothetical protein